MSKVCDMQSRRGTKMGHRNRPLPVRTLLKSHLAERWYGRCQSLTWPSAELGALSGRDAVVVVSNLAVALSKPTAERHKKHRFVAVRKSSLE